MKVFLIRIFKLFLKIIYFFLKLLPTNKKKIVFISRQHDYINIDFIMIGKELMRRDSSIKTVYLCMTIKKGMINYLKYGINIFKQMYHLATSKLCILDSYCIPVSILNHKKNLIILQIWHSIGKIKKSGYQTLGSKSGRNKKIAEVMCMHKNYTNIVAGGVAFNKFYVAGFNCDKKVLLNYGLPRIDYLLENETKIKNKILDKYPEFKNKKIVLYAPTFRKYEPFGVKELIDEYDDNDFILIIKGHPKQKIKVDSSKKIYQCPEFKNADILSVADYVITDYSSICLEAAVLNKKVLFYLYDYEKYIEENGINLDAFKVLPTCTSKKIDELFNIIKKDLYDSNSYQRFRKRYLPKQLGNSTNLIVNYIMKNL